MSAVKMAVLGPVASFSLEAMEKFGAMHGLDLEAVVKTPFSKVFDEIVGETALGIIPIENSLGGLVYSNLDFMLAKQLTILGEYYLPVRQFLLGYNNGSDIKGKTVHSHPQGIEQCAGFIRKNSLVISLADSTSGGAEYVSKLSGDEKYGHLAIASEKAAQEFGLDIMAANIHDNSKNVTRFVVVRPKFPASPIEEKIRIYNGHKATFVYTGRMQDKHKVLHFLGENNFPLINDQSRPFPDDANGDKVFNRRSYLEYSVRSLSEFKTVLAALKDVAGNALQLMSLYPADNLNLRFVKAD